MTYLLYLIAVLAICCTVVITLTAIVFCMSMGANLSPEEIRLLRNWVFGFTVLGIAGVMIAVLLMRSGFPGWGAIAATIPCIISIVVFVVAVLK